MLQLKRIYEDYQSNDGERVLVDRLWPRGIKKEDAKIDQWLKEITPSNQLRQWFHSDEGNFEQFEQYYRKELDENMIAQSICQDLATTADSNTVTLIYAAKNETENHARVLEDYIEQCKKD